MKLQLRRTWNGLLAQTAVCFLASAPAAQPAPEQPQAEQVLRGALAVSPARFDVSAPLSSIRPLPPEPWTAVREMPEPEAEPDARAEAERHRDARDPVQQSALTGGALPVAPMPAPLISFDGIRNISGVLPPDTNGDVGPHHYVQMVNLAFQIWDKRGKSLYGPASLRTLWRGFGPPCEVSDHGDPNVLYDPLADRWLLTQFILKKDDFGECLAVSTGPDPTGSYYRYYFHLAEDVLWDYPHFGVWPDGYYMAANLFGARGYHGAAAVAFDRAKMLVGDPTAGYQGFMAKLEGTLQPADLDGTRPPPEGAPNLFAQRDEQSLNLYRFHVDWTDPKRSTFSGPTALRVAPYRVPCDDAQYRCVPQPSTGQRLDSLWDRVLQRLAYRNFGTHESWVVNHTVQAEGARPSSGIRWYEVRATPSGGAPLLFQQGTYDGRNGDGVWRWMGSVAMDRSGGIAMGYSASDGVSLFPSLRFAGRLANDPPNVLPRGEGTLIGGGSAQEHGSGRWGDYAAMSVDPADDCTFWFTAEYYPAGPANESDWRTRIGAFRFPECASAGGSTDEHVPGP
jgi:hypothetical protein